MMRLPKKLSGSSPQSVEWNLMVDWLARLRPVSGPLETMQQTPFGYASNPGAKPPGGGGGSGFVFPSAIKYDKSASYKVNDVVLIEPWDTICGGAYDLYKSQIAGSPQTAYAMPGWYVCVQASAPATYQSVTQYHVPQQPPAQTNAAHTAGAAYNYNDANLFWVMIAPYPSQQYALKTLNNADYYTANTWDGTTIGLDDVKIAKPKRLRVTVASEVIDGVTVTYSYGTPADDNNRTASDGTNSEYQVAFPRFKGHGKSAGGTVPDTLSIVSAYVPLLGTGVTAGGVPVYLEEFLPSRVWARRYVQ